MVCTAAPLTVMRLEDEAALSALREPWNRLAGGMPFRSWDWLQAAWRCFRTPGRRLFAAAIYDETGALVGLAPWYLERAPLSGRVVRFIGSDDVCSDYLTVLTDAERRQAVVAALAEWLTVEMSAHWDLLELQGVAAGDGTLDALLGELEHRGCAVHVRAGLNCWRLRLPTDWETYLGSLSRNRRQQCRSTYRKTFGAGRAVRYLAEDEDGFARGLGVLVDLHQRRRRSLGQTGCFAVTAFSDFLRTAGWRLLQRGALRLEWIEVDGSPVCADIDLVGNGCVYGYQCGIDPSRPKLNPGMLMVCAALERTIDEGFREFDFLRGDEEYKSRWGAAPRPLIDVRVVPPQAVSRFRHTVRSTGERVGRWMKRRWPITR